MPSAIILYEIDESFGPNILAEYYLKQDDKITPAILKEFSDKHVKKELLHANILEDNNRYYSSIVNAKSIEKDNLYLCFKLREGETLVSLKSIFDNVEEKIVKKFTTDKKKMSELLKDALNSILSLMEKLQEPKIIKETINERTKIMIDDGKLQEARELIDLGEKIPEKLSAEVRLAEQLLVEKSYRKAKKSFLQAAELAVLIQEKEIASFLENKGEQVGNFPDLIRERESLYKDIEKIITELQSNRLYLYNYLVDPLEKLLDISNIFEENELIDVLTKLKNTTQRASRLAKDLYGLDNKIKEFLDKI